MLTTEMADNLAITNYCKRYNIMLMMWQPPKENAMQVCKRKNPAFHPYEINASEPRNRNTHAMMINFDTGTPHFEPVLSTNGNSARPGRFKVWDRQERDGYDPVICQAYTSPEIIRRV